MKPAFCAVVTTGRRFGVRHRHAVHASCCDCARKYKRVQATVAYDPLHKTHIIQSTLVVAHTALLPTSHLKSSTGWLHPLVRLLDSVDSVQKLGCCFLAHRVTQAVVAIARATPLIHVSQRVRCGQYVLGVQRTARAPLRGHFATLFNVNPEAMGRVANI